MPSFVCDHCQETLKKAKLDQHAQRCRNAVFSCIDCYKNFKGTEYRDHFSCITEVQKYHVKQGAVPPIKNTNKNNNKVVIKPVAVKESKSKSPKSDDKITSAIKHILKSNPTATMKVLKKELKKVHDKKDFKKFLQNKLRFTFNQDTDELLIKLN